MQYWVTCYSALCHQDPITEARQFPAELLLCIYLPYHHCTYTAASATVHAVYGCIEDEAKLLDQVYWSNCVSQISYPHQTHTCYRPKVVEILSLPIVRVTTDIKLALGPC